MGCISRTYFRGGLVNVHFSGRANEVGALEGTAFFWHVQITCSFQAIPSTASPWVWGGIFDVDYLVYREWSIQLYLLVTVCEYISFWILFDQQDQGGITSQKKSEVLRKIQSTCLHQLYLILTGCWLGANLMPTWCQLSACFSALSILTRWFSSTLSLAWSLAWSLACSYAFSAPSWDKNRGLIDVIYLIARSTATESLLASRCIAGCERGIADFINNFERRCSMGCISRTYFRGGIVNVHFSGRADEVGALEGTFFWHLQQSTHIFMWICEKVDESPPLTSKL